MCTLRFIDDLGKSVPSHGWTFSIMQHAFISYIQSLEFCTMNTRLDSMKQFDCKKWEWEWDEKRKRSKEYTKKWNSILYNSNYCICNECATLIGTARQLFGRRIQNTCVCSKMSWKSQKQWPDNEQRKNKTRKNNNNKTNAQQQQKHQQ